MRNILSEIVENKKSEVAAYLELLADEPGGVSAFQQKVVPGTHKFIDALRMRPGVKVIAEIKRKSPSAGVIADSFDLEKVVANYCQGATALSVVTDQKYFDGSFHLLESASRLSGLPTLCKDFVIDPIQCFQARQAGADAILLIVKSLNNDAFAQLHRTAIALGMTPVVEVQNEAELERAKAVGAHCLLINNRNLETFEVDLGTTSRLAPLAPTEAVVISASGICSPDDIRSLSSVCEVFLIGTSLMKASNSASLIKELCAAI